MTTEPPIQTRQTVAETVVERAILGSRWILVPFHAGLLLTIVILLTKFVQVALATLAGVVQLSVKDVIVASLSLIELALITSLILMVIFSSYEGFISRLDRHGHQRAGSELRDVGFGTLKHRLMASIATIAGVYLLETVMQGGDRMGSAVAWAAGTFALFVIASVSMERFSKPGALPDAAPALSKTSTSPEGQSH